MLEELTFRILFLSIYALFASIRIYYRRKHPTTNKTEDSQRTLIERIGGWAGLILSIGVLGLIISMILYLVIPPWIPWFPLPFPSLVRWIGVILGFSTVPLLFWIHHTLGRYYSAILEIREEHAIITVGPYSRVRHPMYTIFILFTFSSLLLTANLLVTVFAIILIPMFYPISKREEQMLLAQFGDQYREYMNRTGRFLPRIRPQKQNTK